MAPFSWNHRRAATYITVAVVASSIPCVLVAQAVDTVTVREIARLPEPFSRVASVRVLSDGRMVVVDTRDRSVSLVDARLRNVMRIGREGTGPGEYASPREVLALPADSTAVLDYGTMRLSILDKSLRVVAQQPMLGGSGIFHPKGAARGLWFFHNPDRSRPLSNNRLPVLQVDRRSGTVSVAAQLEVDPEFAQAWAGGWGAPRSGLFARDVYTVTGGGALIVVRHDPYRVERIGADGRVVRGPDRKYQKIRVTNADKEEWAAQFTRMRPTLRVESGRTGPVQLPAPSLDRTAFPEDFPPFLDEDAAIAAPGEAVWVKRAIPTRLHRTEYDVYDTAGVLRGVVQLSAEQRVVGFAGTQLVMVTVDDDGSEWLSLADLPSFAHR